MATDWYSLDFDLLRVNWRLRSSNEAFKVELFLEGFEFLETIINGKQSTLRFSIKTEDGSTTYKGKLVVIQPQPTTSPSTSSTPTGEPPAPYLYIALNWPGSSQEYWYQLYPTDQAASTGKPKTPPQPVTPPNQITGISQPVNPQPQPTPPSPQPVVVTPQPVAPAPQPTPPTQPAETSPPASTTPVQPVNPNPPQPVPVPSPVTPPPSASPGDQPSSPPQATGATALPDPAPTAPTIGLLPKKRGKS